MRAGGWRPGAQYGHNVHMTTVADQNAAGQDGASPAGQAATAAQAAPAPAAARPRSARPLLSVAGVGAWFGELVALEDVDLRVWPGEIVALAGENGAGKTTLVRCISGDIAPSTGAILMDGTPVAPDPPAARRRGIGVVWQDLALCDNLDVAANLMLGRERRRQLFSDSRIHRDARGLLDRLGIPLPDTTRSVRALSGGQRQLVAVARAMAHQPRLLLLDEPTASLGVREAALVEELICRLRDQGTTMVLACHDISQMFRLADRIAVLRHGRVIADVTPGEVHPDDVVALLSGQAVDTSARRQLTRLHSLHDQLASADASSSLPLILSALGTALDSEHLCIHLLENGSLNCAAALGLPAALGAAWARLPCRAGGRPGRPRRPHRAADSGRTRQSRLGGVRPAGQGRPGRQLLVGPGTGPRRPARRDHRAARLLGTAAARRP